MLLESTEFHGHKHAIEVERLAAETSPETLAARAELPGEPLASEYRHCQLSARNQYAARRVEETRAQDLEAHGQPLLTPINLHWAVGLQPVHADYHIKVCQWKNAEVRSKHAAIDCPRHRPQNPLTNKQAAAGNLNIAGHLVRTNMREVGHQ